MELGNIPRNTVIRGGDESALESNDLYQGDGSVEVALGSAEWHTVADYFGKSGGSKLGAEEVGVVKVRNQYLAQKYQIELQRNRLERHREEAWLFHCAGDVGFLNICSSGWEIAYSSMERNDYGVGIYFATDARKAHFFAARGAISAKRHETTNYKVFLCRVAIGKCVPKQL